jgi:hypothetical protein
MVWAGLALLAGLALALIARDARRDRRDDDDDDDGPGGMRRRRAPVPVRVRAPAGRRGRRG